MGERKVLNKYYPPDFDPAKMPKGNKGKFNEMKVRMMLPMTVRCSTCGSFMYKGTKFNTRKEDVANETYLGLLIFRFYYRCTNCAAEFCMKTDPKTADYILEAGATRNYEPWRDKEASADEIAAEREEEERGNAMKALENRTLDSKREMDVMAALDEMRSLKARHNKVSTAEALEALKHEAERQMEGQETTLRDEDADDLAEFYKLKREQLIDRHMNDSSSSGGSGDEGGQAQRQRAGNNIREDPGAGSGEEEGPLAAGRHMAAASQAAKRRKQTGGEGALMDEGPHLATTQGRHLGEGSSTDAGIQGAGMSRQAGSQAAQAAQPPPAPAPLRPLIKVVAKPKVKASAPVEPAVEEEEEEEAGGGLAGLLGGYDSSETSQ